MGKKGSDLYQGLIELCTWDIRLMVTINSLRIFTRADRTLPPFLSSLIHPLVSYHSLYHVTFDIDFYFYNICSHLFVKIWIWLFKIFAVQEFYLRKIVHTLVPTNGSGLTSYNPLTTLTQLGLNATLLPSHLWWKIVSYSKNYSNVELSHRSRVHWQVIPLCSLTPVSIYACLLIVWIY